jgi:hypothetical protein
VISAALLWLLRGVLERLVAEEQGDDQCEPPFKATVARE